MRRDGVSWTIPLPNIAGPADSAGQWRAARLSTRICAAPGVAYALGSSGRDVIRAGFGLYYDDLAQNGWWGAFQSVNTAPLPCVNVVTRLPIPVVCLELPWEVRVG